MTNAIATQPRLPAQAPLALLRLHQQQFSLLADAQPSPRQPRA